MPAFSHLVYVILAVSSIICSQVSCASWRRPKLEQCDLHPDIASRIHLDVSYWGDGGITEDVALSMCKHCDLPPQDFSSPNRMHKQKHRRRRLAKQQEEPQPYLPDNPDQELEQEAQQQISTQSQQTKPVGRVLQGGGTHGAGAPDCNLPQRVLVSGGVVYLNNLVPAERLGPFEHIGFLVELYEASQVFKLPDVEFTYWFGDNAPGYTTFDAATRASLWPHPPAGGMPPVLTWSKWNENAAMVVPYSGAFRCPSDSWDALESQLETLMAVPWSGRKEVAFGRWNGFCTHYIPWMKTADGKVMKCPRTHLNSLATARPDLLDTYDLGAAHPVPLAHQNSYKYIVSTDGWSISSKFDKYLLMGSTVLKAASTRFGFYYDAIKPYTHYLPFMVNSSDDIIDVVTWARALDDEAAKVAAAGQRFAVRNLKRTARLCYLFRLLTELSKKMRYPVSCSRRQLCVPLVQDIRFLAAYPRTNKSCRYHEVMLQYGDDDPAAEAEVEVAVPSSTSTRTASTARVQYSLEVVQRLHEMGTAWPRDDLRGTPP